MSGSKQEVREEIRRRQAQFDLADVQRAGMRIGASLEILLTHYFKPTVVMCYVSTTGEPPTHDIIRSCLKRGQRVCVPCMGKGGGAIVPCELQNFTSDLERGYSGILEPRDTCRRPVDLGEIDIHLIPGVAFDPNGGRLGRGGGHYDRFLAGCNPQVIKMGLAFSWQIVEEVPREEHDIGMDLIVTEQGVVPVRKGLLE